MMQFLPGLPVHGRDQFVLRRELEGVYDPEDLLEFAAGAGGVSERQLDGVVRSDGED